MEGDTEVFKNDSSLDSSLALTEAGGQQKTERRLFGRGSSS